MEDYPGTILEFEKRFATEAACREYLFGLRWPEGFICPACGGREYWETGRALFRCRGCDFQASVTSGTIFQNTRKPLQLWFRAMWLVTSQKQGASALNLQRVLGLGSYRTAWTWLHKLRHAMVRPGRDKLSGTVEVDEAYLGGERPGKPGRGALGKTLVLVAVEDNQGKTGRIRLKRVRDASAASLNKAVEECVEPGSAVRTDGWTGYYQLAHKGFVHSVARPHAATGKNLLPKVNRVVSLLKRWLLGIHQGAVQPSYLDYYLDEFTFRFNRRTSKSRGKLFYRLAEQAVAVTPLKGSNIKGGTAPS